MTTSYPSGYDSLTNPTTGNLQNSPSHAAQHANANDAIEAIEHALGNSAVGGKLFSGHFWIPAAGIWPTITSGASGQSLVETSSNKNALWSVDFEAGINSRAEATVAIPDWDGGTVTCQFYWSVDSTSTVAVTWQVAVRAYGDGSALDAGYGGAVTVSDTGSGTAGQLRISAATAAVTIAGASSAGSMIQFRFNRRGDTDTMPDMARLRGVMVNYTRA